MINEIYRYEFPAHVALEEVEATLVLVIAAVEALHGDAQVRLELRHLLDQDQRKCVIDATTSVGRDFNRLFAGFLLREFGKDAFKVDRVNNQADSA
jgi:hypothetical protein